MQFIIVLNLWEAHMNRVKDMLKAGETAIGTDGRPQADVRFLADSGFDFLLFDTQHSPVQLKELMQPIGLSLIHI